MTDVLAEATTVPVARSTGRAVGSVHAMLLVLESTWTWYKRNWKATLFSSVGIPVLYLLAMGLGFGSQVRSTAMTGGYGYLVYLAPALLASGAVQTASGECTFPVLSGFKWAKTFVGITATPVTPGQLLGGWMLWVTSRLTLASSAYLVVAVAVGAVTGPGILLSLVFGVLTGIAFGAPVIAFAASLDGEGHGFNPLFRFIVLPMTLFAGTFFPVSQLPAAVRPIAWLTPLWHGTELARGAAFGTLQLWPTIGHIAYLVALLTVGTLLARWRFRVRLAS